jgi:hypothetical protein
LIVWLRVSWRDPVSSRFITQSLSAAAARRDERERLSNGPALPVSSSRISSAKRLAMRRASRVEPW